MGVLEKMTELVSAKRAKNTLQNEFLSDRNWGDLFYADIMRKFNLINSYIYRIMQDSSY